MLDELLTCEGRTPTSPIYPRAPAPRSYLYRPKFSGRERELSVLLARLDQLQAGGGSLTLIRGESGIGKTRLTMEVARSAQAGSLPVIFGSCSPSGPVLHPILKAAGSHCSSLPEPRARRNPPLAGAARKPPGPLCPLPGRTPRPGRLSPSR